MIEILDKTGRVIRRSKNLRGILDHARREYVVEARVEHDPADLPLQRRDGYRVTFVYGNGDSAVAHFADWRVFIQWIHNRRSWGMQRVGNWRWRANHMLESKP